MALFPFIIVTKCLRQQRQIALWVKYFAHKNEDLSSDPRHPHQKPGVIVNACKSNAGEAGTGESLGMLSSLSNWQDKVQQGTLCQKSRWRGWRDSLGVRSTCCSYISSVPNTASEAHNHPKLHFHGICCPLLTFTGPCMYTMHTHALHTQS